MKTIFDDVNVFPRSETNDVRLDRWWKADRGQGWLPCKVCQQLNLVCQDTLETCKVDWKQNEFIGNTPLRFETKSVVWKQ